MTWYERDENVEELSQTEIEDLNAVLKTPEGYRTILRWLNVMGAESFCSASEYSVALRNMAERILQECQQASFNNMLKLIADIREYRHGRRSIEQ